MFGFVLTVLVIGQKKITWQKDGAEMVLIPAGTFEMSRTPTFLDGLV